MAGFSYLLCLVCSIPVGVWLLLDIQKSDGTSSEKSSWTTTMYCFTLRKILKINFTKPWACPFKWHWVTLRLLEPYTTPCGLFENFTWVSKVILQSIFELIRNLGKIPLLHITSVPIPFSWGLTHWLFLRNKNLLGLIGNKPCPQFGLFLVVFVLIVWQWTWAAVLNPKVLTVMELWHFIKLYWSVEYYGRNDTASQGCLKTGHQSSVFSEVCWQCFSTGIPSRLSFLLPPALGLAARPVCIPTKCLLLPSSCLSAPDPYSTSTWGKNPVLLALSPCLSLSSIIILAMPLCQ